MSDNKRTKMDFDTWAEIARRDPDAFERMRLAAIDDFINDLPKQNQERLRRFQWRIDQERRRSKTPLGACIRISNMMWQSLLGEGGLRDRFSALAALLQQEPEGTAATADILVFYPRNRS